MSLPVERVTVSLPPDGSIDPDGWPLTLPAVADLAASGLDLGPVTVLVGENGSGKSTLVEALAMAYGMSSEGGSTGARHATRPSESELWRAITLRRGIGASRWGFFLRAETMHGFYSYLEANDPNHVDPDFHALSHGESFVELLGRRFEGPGLYVLDEPESALSFTNVLGLVGLLHRLAAGGRAQVVLATHSPVLAAIPEARVLELGEWGLRERVWADLDLVQNWQGFLADPQLYLKYLLDD